MNVRKKLLLGAASAACALSALVLPASACPNGYESVWIQGHRICKIKTPKLDLKTKTIPELNGATRGFKAG